MAAISQERFPGAEMFLDESGQLNENARRAWWRVQADTYYLSLWRRHGALEAGRMTCERFGHMRRGNRCERCGGPA